MEKNASRSLGSGRQQSFTRGRRRVGGGLASKKDSPAEDRREKACAERGGVDIGWREEGKERWSCADLGLSSSEGGGMDERMLSAAQFRVLPSK